MFQPLQKLFGITCVHRMMATLGNYLYKRRPKRDKWNTSHVVYSVPCEDPQHQYIGQTKRMMKVRIKEQEKSCIGDLTDIQPDTTNDKGISYHHTTTGHNFLFDQTKILTIENNLFLRKLLKE